MRIGLLECDHVDAHLRDVAGDYLDMFTRLFAEHAPQVTLEPIDVVGGQALPAPDAFDGWLVGGSRHGAYERDRPWIPALEEHVRAADAAGRPVVGICFGHQLLAQAFGGEVAKADVGWGVGVHEANVIHREDWLEPDASAFRLLVTHQDQVVRLPEGAQVVATSVHAPIAAFRHGRVLGFQGHPEFVPAYAQAVMGERAERIGAPTVEAARATLDTPTDHGLVARWIANFLTGSG